MADRLIYGLSTVYAQSHQTVNVDTEGINLETAVVLLTKVGYEAGKEPLTVSVLGENGFTVYNGNHCGVAFNWLVAGNNN